MDEASIFNEDGMEKRQDSGRLEEKHSNSYIRRGTKKKQQIILGVQKSSEL